MLQIRSQHSIRQWAQSFVLVLCAVTTLFASATAQAITSTDLYNINTNTPFFDPNATDCGDATTANNAESGNTGLHLDANQVANVKTIIGIAKTDNLGQAGAVIGIAVGLDESHLRIEANTNVPISLTNPAKQAVGSDHDSVGVFQQRISTDWSTISNNPNDQAAVFQLMDTAYGAEAFFGSPPGSNAPRQLSKGLQNVSGWQNLEPWVAAQKVQISFDPTGSNYKVFVTQAEQIVAQYYNDSPAIPLPVAITGGTPTTAANTCAVLTSYQCGGQTAGTAKILCEAQKYKGIWYDFGGGHQGRAAYVRGCPDPANPPNNQPSGGPLGGNPSPCAVDCSSLVSMAVDDAFGTNYNWVVSDIVADHALWQRISLSQAQPGDVVTVGTEHIEIFVSYDATNKTVHTFGAHHTGTQTGPSQAGTGYYDGVYRYTKAGGPSSVTL